MADYKIGISTHVLDIARGKPANGVPVRLEWQEDRDQWRTIGSRNTDGDGRCGNLLSDRDELAPGIYRLTFDTATYYSMQGVQPLHPLVQITFLVRDGETHLHVPLLLSPHGYTTYRGA
ncbi:MAG TPA: hydroxyisourate hydrolase [Terriglobales bacterium]|nr:hydroxyisourate hydrolase [Terriglobales bacterium]